MAYAVMGSFTTKNKGALFTTGHTTSSTFVFNNKATAINHAANLLTQGHEVAIKKV